MRRALAESLQRPERMECPDHGDDDDDDDMALALRLSQVQMEEEERFRKSFLEPSEDDPLMGQDSFSNLIQPYPGASSLRGNRREFQSGADETDFVPPVRSRPSQEPPSPGVPPRGQNNGSPRGDWGRRMGAGHMPGNRPQPSIEDLESLSQHVRETLHQPSGYRSQDRDSMFDQANRYSASQHAKVPAKVHAPDDGDDMRPVTRPQRKDQKHLSGARSGTAETQISNVVDIDRDSRDVLVREGQSETRAAIRQGQSQIVTCHGCFGKLHAPVNCALVFCPTCNTVSQVSSSEINHM